MSRRTVCFVLPTLAPGGTERQLLYLMEGLRARFDIATVCTGRNGSWAAQAGLFGTVHAFDLRSGWDPRLRRLLGEYFEAHPADVVHSFMFGFDYEVNRAARDAGVPVVISSRRQLAQWKKPRHVRLQQKANELVDAIVANSEAAADFAAEQEGLPRDRYTVIHNGIVVSEPDVEPFPNTPEIEPRLPADKRTVGMVANFSPVKDHGLFVGMAAELNAMRDDVHFVLAGSGPQLKKVKRLVAISGLEEAFSWCDGAHDARGLHRLLDVAVLTSRAEGFPNVLMEAMVAARPVVAAAVGGIPELVVPEETGTLVETRNPSDFARAVKVYLDDELLARRVGHAAKESVESRFNVEKMVDAYGRLYREMLTKTGRM